MQCETQKHESPYEAQQYEVTNYKSVVLGTMCLFFFASPLLTVLLETPAALCQTIVYHSSERKASRSLKIEESGNLLSPKLLMLLLWVTSEMK